MPKQLTLILAALVALTPGLAMARAVPDPAPACTSPAQSLDEKGFVRIGGIDQWITIRGDRCDNPVILFLHGGPGNPLSPFADAIYGAWTRDFTLVQWDQRGSGKTLGRSPPAETDSLTVAGMTTDGIAVATYLVQHLGTRKVILMGSSWGSILGVNMARTRPDLFHAYVGTSQIVSYRDNQATTYARLLDLARAAGDQETAGRLEALGPPPWANPRAFGVVRRAVRKYEALKTDPFPQTWWSPAADYATPKALADYEAGEDYSFLQFVGFKGDGMFSGVELAAPGARFETPVFLLQGTEDLLTTADVTQRFFDGLTAPRKALVLVPRAGHDPNQPMVDAQYRLLLDQVKPGAR